MRAELHEVTVKCTQLSLYNQLWESCAPALHRETLSGSRYVGFRETWALNTIAAKVHR